MGTASHPDNYFDALFLACSHHPDLGNGGTVETRRQSSENCPGCHRHEQSCGHCHSGHQRRKHFLHQLRRKAVNVILDWLFKTNTSYKGCDFQ